MFLDLVDSLRCPAAHEDTWLVATVDEWRDARVVRGTLGCPVCRAEYPVLNGVIAFVRGERAPVRGSDEHAESIDHASVLRLAALLDLTQPGGIVLLAGAYAAQARWLAAVTPAHYVAATRPGEVVPAGASIGLVVGDRLPIAAHAVRAAAIDAAAAEGPWLEEFTRVLRAGGRLVAPAEVRVPPGVEELARDEREWVGAASGAVAAPVPLRRR